MVLIRATVDRWIREYLDHRLTHCWTGKETELYDFKVLEFSYYTEIWFFDTMLHITKWKIEKYKQELCHLEIQYCDPSLFTQLESVLADA